MEEVFTIIDKSWKAAKGNLARDPSGGLAAIINSDAFIAARSEPPMDIEDFDSGDDDWLIDDLDDDDAVFSIRERPSFGYPGTPAPEEFASHRKNEADGVNVDAGYVPW